MGAATSKFGNWYTGDPVFDTVQAIQLALVGSTILGTGTVAPYGKHANDSLGSLHLNPKFGWWLMELPATACFLPTYLLSQSPVGKDGPSSKVSKLLASLFMFHYAYRGWFFPLSLRVAKGSTTSFNIAVSLIGAIFTGLHGFLHARMYKSLGAHLTDEWVKHPRFLLGLAIYQLAFWTMVHSDYTIRNLRSTDGSGPRYKIPTGGAFRFVTSPQYLGEISAFGGMALMTNSLPSAAVFAITCFNLIPRSFHNHTWYMKKFGEEYEKLGRKRLIPFLL